MNYTAFDYVQCQAGSAHQVHDNVEDAFIDEMAMGPLLWKDSRHKLLAGSVEGLVAELIQVTSYRRSLPANSASVYSPFIHYFTFLSEQIKMMMIYI